METADNNEDNKFALAIRTPQTLALESELEAAKKNAAVVKKKAAFKSDLYSLGVCSSSLVCIGSACSTLAGTLCLEPVTALISAAVGIGGFFSLRFADRASARYKAKKENANKAVAQLEQSLRDKRLEAATQTLRLHASAILDKTFATREPLANTEIALAVDGGSDKVLRVDAVHPITHMEDNEPLHKGWDLTVTLYEIAGQTVQGIPIKGDPVAILPRFRHAIAKTENAGPR